jgi:hypothetical protein
MILKKGTRVVIEASESIGDMLTFGDDTDSLEDTVVDYKIYGYFQAWASVPYIQEITQGQWVAFAQTKAVVLMEDGSLNLYEIEDIKIDTQGTTN